MQSAYGKPPRDCVAPFTAARRHQVHKVSDTRTWALYDPCNIEHVVFASRDAYPFGGVRLELIELAHQATKDSGRDRLSNTVRCCAHCVESTAYHV